MLHMGYLWLLLKISKHNDMTETRKVHLQIFTNFLPLCLPEDVQFVWSSDYVDYLEGMLADKESEEARDGRKEIVRFGCNFRAESLGLRQGDIGGICTDRWRTLGLTALCHMTGIPVLPCLNTAKRNNTTFQCFCGVGLLLLLDV